MAEIFKAFEVNPPGYVDQVREPTRRAVHVPELLLLLLPVIIGGGVTILLSDERPRT